MKSKITNCDQLPEVKEMFQPVKLGTFNQAYLNLLTRHGDGVLTSSVKYLSLQSQFHCVCHRNFPLRWLLADALIFWGYLFFHWLCAEGAAICAIVSAIDQMQFLLPGVSLWLVYTVMQNLSEIASNIRTESFLWNGLSIYSPRPFHPNPLPGVPLSSSMRLRCICSDN